MLRRAATLVAAIVAGAPLGVAAQEPRFTVRGTITDALSLQPVVGATVELAGFDDRITNQRGEFVVRDVEAGPYRLTVQALGYRAYEVDVIVRGDTSLAISLEVDAILLESIRARSREVDVRGKVRSAGSDHGIPDATVMIGPKPPVTSNLRGDFRVRDLVEGVPVPVRIGALGFRPADFEILPADGQKLDVEMVPDPVGRRMIAEQIERLETRAREVPKPYRVLHREDLDEEYGWPLDMMLASRFGRRVRLRCVIIDEVSLADQRLPGETATEVIASYLTQEIERIEVFDNWMVRIYTRRFIQDMMAGKARSLISINLDMPSQLACL